MAAAQPIRSPAVALGSLPWYDMVAWNGKIYAVPVTVDWAALDDFAVAAAAPGAIVGDTPREVKERIAHFWGPPGVYDRHDGWTVVKWGEAFFAAQGDFDIFADPCEADDAVLKDYSAQAVRLRIDGVRPAMIHPSIPAAFGPALGAGSTFVAVRPPDLFAPDPKPPRPPVSDLRFGRIDGRWIWGLSERFRMRRPAAAPSDPGRSAPSDPWRNVRDFHRELLETGKLQIPCPVCGAASSFVDGAPMFNDGHVLPIFYRYECCVGFHLIVGFQPAELMGVVVDDEPYVFSFLQYDHPTLWVDCGPVRFARLIASFAAGFFRPGPPPTAVADTRLAVMVGFVANVGHHVREELPALIRWSRSRRGDDDTVVVIGPNDHFDLARIFPDAVRCPSPGPERRPLAVRTADFCRAHRLIPTRLTCCEHFLPEAGAAMLEIARGAIPQDDPRLRALNRFRRRFWITVRNGNRRWTSQVDGLSRIVAALLADDPELAVAFDGVASARPVVDAVVANQTDPDRCVDALEMPMAQALVPFAEVDGFLMPYSNSASYAFLIEKPGVFHGARGFVPEGRFRLIPGQDAVPCVGVVGEPVATGNKVYDEHPNTADYDLDWRALLSAVRAVLRPT